MLHKLRIENCFAHADSTFDFEKGMTAISGPNFRGKSQILEMARFALFGAAALRTNATDYKGAKVTLDFSVMTRRFRIERTTTNAKLYEGDALLCTGTKPTNLKIVDIFGYGLEVFDTANVATQGMIEALGAMRPADRKRLVDSTIGLNVLDDLAKWCGDEAGLKTRELSAIRATAVVPVEPERPAQYRPLAELVAERQRLTTLVVEKQGVERGLAAEPPAPAVPVCLEPRPLEVLETISRGREVLLQTAVDLTTRLSALPKGAPTKPMCMEPRTLEELETLSRGRAVLIKTAADLTISLKALLPASSVTLEWCDQMEANWANYLAREAATLFMKDNPKPAYTVEKLETMEARLHAHDRWKAWHELDKKGHTECPACRHTWPHEESRMKELGDWKGKPEPERPAINSLLMINSIHHQWAKYNSNETDRAAHRLVLAAHPDLIEQPYASIESIKAARRQIEAAPRRASLEDELAKVRAELEAMPDVAEALTNRVRYEAALSVYNVAMEAAPRRASLETELAKIKAELGALPDVAEAIGVRKAYDAAMRIYNQALETHAAWAAQAPVWRARLAELTDVEAQAEATIALQIMVQTYDNMLERYAQDLVAYEAVTAKVEALEAEVDQYGRAKVGLTELKSRVKGYLVPSLSRVSSMILSQMTGGALGHVQISEDFDIVVGDKPIDGLSGCGKAAANLAIRIGLGQVLTNRVFSVFMADEIDAAMDNDNAGFTAACLKSLTSSISQIILVSHKNAEADHYIRL